MKKGYTKLCLVALLVLVLFIFGCAEEVFTLQISHRPNIDSGIDIRLGTLARYSTEEIVTLNNDMPSGNYRLYQAVLVPTGKLTLQTVETGYFGPYTTITSSTITKQLNQHYTKNYGGNPPSGYAWLIYSTGLHSVNLGGGSYTGKTGASITNIMLFMPTDAGDFYPIYAFGAASSDSSPQIVLNQTWKMYLDHIKVYNCQIDTDCQNNQGCINGICLSCRGYNPNQIGCCSTLIYRTGSCNYGYSVTKAKDCLMYKNANAGAEPERCYNCFGNTTSDWSCEAGISPSRCQQYGTFFLGSWSPFACTSNADCNDNNLCTSDICLNPSSCNSRCSRTNLPDGTSCGNGGICSGGQCVGECPEGTIKVSRLCGTTDSSVPEASACVSLENDYVCSDYPNANLNSCTFNTTLYREGETIHLESASSCMSSCLPSPRNLICSNAHWCPVGFEYNAATNLCQFPQETCEQGPLSEISCKKGTGTPMTWGLWTDQDTINGINPFWNPKCFYWGDQNNVPPPFYEACCEDKQWAGNYYFTRQSITTDVGDVSGPPYDVRRNYANICGDNYQCGVADGICPEIYANFNQPGICRTEDVDCCNSAIWNGTRYANRTFVWMNGKSCCGNEPDEFFRWEQGISLPNSKVLDTTNTTACCTRATDCVSDGVCYREGTTIDVDKTSGDSEICIGGFWHDPDESQELCKQSGTYIKIGFTWISSEDYSLGMNGIDDYDNDLTNGFCDGDDGVKLYGHVTEQIAFGNDATQSADGVSVGVNIEDLTSHLATSTTDSSGYYELSLPPGRYTITFSKPRYLTETLTKYEISEERQQDIVLQLNNECQDDCTKNDFVCHRDCDNKAGCRFFDDFTRSKCDGKRKGWLIDYGSQKAECCTGGPVLPQSYIVPSHGLYNLEFPSDIRNIITVKRNLYYRGKPIIMYITLYRCDENEACRQAIQS